jgi:hypothetical protein
VLSRVEATILSFVHSVERSTHLPWYLLVVVVLGGIFVLDLILDSTQGRGRRYRRGYRVGYTETLGRERAKMRVKMEEKGEKKPGWRERRSK